MNKNIDIASDDVFIKQWLDDVGDWAGHWTNPNTIGVKPHFKLYCDIIEWLKENIDDVHENARWRKLGDCIYVDIRHEHDWTLFLLRWS